MQRGSPNHSNPSRVSLAASSIYSRPASQAIDRLGQTQDIPEVPAMPLKFRTIDYSAPTASISRTVNRGLTRKDGMMELNGRYHDADSSKQEALVSPRTVTRVDRTGVRQKGDTVRSIKSQIRSPVRATSSDHIGDAEQRPRSFRRSTDRSDTPIPGHRDHSSRHQRQYGPGSKPPSSLAQHQPSLFRKLSDEGRSVAAKITTALRHRGSSSSNTSHPSSAGHPSEGVWRTRSVTVESTPRAASHSRGKIYPESHGSHSFRPDTLSQRKEADRRLRHAGPNIADHAHRPDKSSNSNHRLRRTASAREGSPVVEQAYPTRASSRRERFVSTETRPSRVKKARQLTRGTSEEKTRVRVPAREPLPARQVAVVGDNTRDTRLTDFINFGFDSLAADVSEFDSSLPNLQTKFEDQIPSARVSPLRIVRQPPADKRVDRSQHSWMPPSPLGSRNRPFKRATGDNNLSNSRKNRTGGSRSKGKEPAHNLNWSSTASKTFRMDADYPETTDLFAELPDEERKPAEREVERLMRRMRLDRSDGGSGGNGQRDDEDDTPSIIIDTFQHPGHTSWLATERPNSQVIHSDYRRFPVEKREIEGCEVERLRKMRVGDWF